MTRTATLRALACITLVSGLASAQGREDADSDRLFKEAQKLMQERRWAEACPKLDMVYRKDQQLGTLLNLAYCHKELGATWLAWVEFKEAEVHAIELKRNDRRDFARQRMSELEKSLARVVVEPTTKVELTDVLIEDHRVPDAEKGVVVAAEPGARKLTFRARGKKPVTSLVTIVKGTSPQRLVVPEMEDAPKEPPPPPPEPPVAAAPSPKAAPPPPPPSSTQKTLGLVVGGAGLLGLGAGAVFGVMTLSSPCSNENDPSCTPSERSSASSNGAVATVAFIAGGAALATGAVLFFTAPRSSSRTARIVPELGVGWAGVHGTF